MKRFTACVLMLTLLACCVQAQFYDQMRLIQKEQDEQEVQTEQWEGFLTCLEKNDVPIQALRKKMEKQPVNAWDWQWAVLDSLDENATNICINRGTEYMLRLLQNNQLAELAQMEQADLLFLLGRALEIYYQELYGQDALFDKTYHYKSFAFKFRNTALEQPVEAFLEDVKQPSGEKIIARLTMGDSVMRMVKWVMFYFVESPAAMRNVNFFCEKPMEKLLNEAYGASVRTNRKDLFHEFKRGVFTEFLKDPYQVIMEKGACFKKLQIAPITQEQQNVVEKTVKKICHATAFEIYGNRYEKNPFACQLYKEIVSKNGYWVDKDKIRAELGRERHPRSVNGHLMPMR